MAAQPEPVQAVQEPRCSGPIWYDFGRWRGMQSKKEILKDLLLSAQTGSVLKLTLKGVANPVITAVDGISQNRISLKPTCLYGYPLEKMDITLLDIEGVKRYKANYDSPLFQKLRFIRNNISQIRNNFHSLGNQSQERLATDLT